MSIEPNTPRLAVYSTGQGSVDVWVGSEARQQGIDAARPQIVIHVGDGVCEFLGHDGLSECGGIGAWIVVNG